MILLITKRKKKLKNPEGGWKPGDENLERGTKKKENFVY